MSKQLFKKWLATVLAFSMLLLVGCGETATVSEPKLNYGNEEYTEDGEDQDSVVVNKDSVVVSKSSTTVGGGNVVEHKDGLKPTVTIDEGKKKTFLESVPSNLSGQTVDILVYWKVFEQETKKMEKFTKETGIKINFIYVDQDNYMQRLSTLKAQKKSPDIAVITTRNYPSAIMQDYFQPISVGKLSMDPKVYDLESMKKLAFGGKQYGALVKGTTYVTMGLLTYNADLFKKHNIKDPYTLWREGNWNWDSFIKTSQDIQKAANVVAVTAPWSGFRLGQTAGEDAVVINNGTMKNNMSSTNYRDAYKWLANLDQDGQYKVADWNLQYDGFLAGKCAMLCTENWALQKGERLNNTSFALGYAPLPCKTNTITVPSDAQLWGFPVGAKHVEAASYALEYWQNPQYNEVGAETWLNDSVAAFVDWLWAQPKCFKVSQGIIEYGGDYSWFDFNFEVSLKPNNVDAEMDKWSKVVDANIKKINEEFSKN